METENTEPTVEFTDENGELIIKELAKEYLTKGAWQTVMFLYQDKNPKTGNSASRKFPSAVTRKCRASQAAQQVQCEQQGAGRSDYRES